MLLRDIDQTLELCNWTRLIIQELTNNVIEAILVTGNHIGDKLCLHSSNEYDFI